MPLPLQMVGFEGSIPVTALPVGRALSIIVFWYQKHLFWKAILVFPLYSVRIIHLYGQFLRNMASFTNGFHY